MTEIYYIKRVENCRTAPESSPGDSRKYLSMTLLAALLFVAAMLAAWQRFGGVQDGYRLERLREDRQQFLEANRKLRLEVAALGDPVRIDTIARLQLGMTSLSPHRIFTVEPVAGMTATPVLAQIRPSAAPLPAPVKNVAAVVP